MCDFGANPNIASIESALHDFGMLLSRINNSVELIHVAPGGSFFSDQEVPPELRRGVIQKLGKLRFLRAIGIETRPNLVSVAKLMEVIEELPHHVRYLTLGFGFECRNDLIREVAINKGYGLWHVEQAINAIDKVNAAQSRVHVTFEVYVMLKPLFLSEQEAIDEALETIDWVYARGAETAVLFMNTIKRNTVQGYLASRMDLEPPLRYQAPFHRSAIQVLRELPPPELSLGAA